MTAGAECGLCPRSQAHGCLTQRLNWVSAEAGGAVLGFTVRREANTESKAHEQQVRGNRGERGHFQQFMLTGVRLITCCAGAESFHYGAPDRSDSSDIP